MKKDEIGAKVVRKPLWETALFAKVKLTKNSIENILNPATGNYLRAPFAEQLFDSAKDD